MAGRRLRQGRFSVELAKRHKEAVLVAVERIGNVMVEGALRAVRENISNLRFLCAGAEYLPRFFRRAALKGFFSISARLSPSRPTKTGGLLIRRFAKFI